MTTRHGYFYTERRETEGDVDKDAIIRALIRRLKGSVTLSAREIMRARVENRAGAGIGIWQEPPSQGPAMTYRIEPVPEHIEGEFRVIR